MFTTRSPFHVLLLAASLFLLPHLRPTEAANPLMLVCVSPRPPFILYNATTQTITGYEWDLFKLVATTLNLNYTAMVLPWADMMSNVMLPANDPQRCDIVPASVPLTFPISTAAGSIKFSIPTFRSGYSIATAVDWNPFDMWSFGRVFTGQLWATLLGTAAVLSVLTYIVERDFATRGLGKTKYPVPIKPGMYEAIYNCVGKLFNVVQDLRVTSLAGKLISLAWGFLVLVVISMYTGTVAATLTATTSVTSVQGLSDLQAGASVIVPDYLVTNFTKYAFTPKGVPMNTDAEQQAALDMVATGQVGAIVAESPWLRYQVQARCDLAIVGSMFKYVSNVVIFSPSTDDTLVYQFNSQLLYQEAQGMYELLQTAYIKPQKTDTCNPSTFVISLKELEGLWYILIGFVGLSFGILMLPYINKAWEVDTAGSRSASISGVSRGKSFVDKIFKRNQKDTASMSGVHPSGASMIVHSTDTSLTTKITPSPDKPVPAVPVVAAYH